jgi:uncharacterized protein
VIASARLAIARPRVETYAWDAIAQSLDDLGYARLPALLTAPECRAVAALYDGGGFRSRVDMARHSFGSGQYKYFSYPLPPLVAALRQALYPPLAQIANRWNERLGVAAQFPAALDAYLGICHAAGQVKPTPLLLDYGVGDYNRLHQDLYGALVFPIQATVLLSDPSRDFTGGEFVLTETRPRLQSRAEVVPLALGDAVAFAVNHRPARGARGFHRVTMRHGVSRILSGHRRTLGIIFHDAK